MSEDIYHEIQEDIRQQQLKAFWAENGNWIIGGIVAAIIFTGALSFWRGYEADRNMQATAGLLAAVDAADPAKLDAFAAATDKDHAMMALFAEARLFADRKQNDKALAVYDRIADMSRIDGTWRDLAKFYSVSARLDSGDPATLHKELGKLEGKKDAFRASAMEMEAFLFAREKKMSEAAETLAKLAADPQTPPDIRTRALTLRNIYMGDVNNAKGNG